MIIAHGSESLTLDDPAFVHAVAFAVASGAAVRGIHVARGAALEPAPPAATALLERWKKPAAAVNHSWLLSVSADDPADALLDTIGALKPELLVLNTHARGGVARIFAGSVAEGVARNAKVPVLLLPTGGPALASAQSGAVMLDRVLLLAGSREDAEPAAEGLSALLKLAGVASCAVELFHVEDGAPAPQVVLPAACEVTAHRSRGPLEAAVVERARVYEPSLVVMTSHGHDQFSDIVFSSHTERVLHEVRRPLLWVPARPRAA